jgi:hypothetical protein
MGKEPTACELLLADEQTLLSEIKELDYMLEKARYDLREVREKRSQYTAQRSRLLSAIASVA